MYENLRGKRLLVIGSEENDANIVRTARELGVTVIVADGKEVSDATPAKKIADESWQMDYSKTELIGEKCREAHIDGVIAGYSEFRVLAACRIAKYLGKPFYATEEQILLTRDKKKFKTECAKYGVRVPKDICFRQEPTEEQMDGITFPVIVKPVDYGGRKGITVCCEREQLRPAVAHALQYSVSGTVIVEEYITGTEFAAVYTLSQGEISLSCLNEKYLNESQQRKTGLCDLAVTPSSFLDAYRAGTDAGVKAFLRGIGARDGVAFFQGIVTPRQEFYIFEMGYRLNGGNDYVLIEQNNGISYLKMLISHALTGSMGDDLAKDDPAIRRYYCNFLLYSRGGVVGKIEYTGAPDHPAIDEVHLYKAPGMKVEEDGSTALRAFTFKLSADTLAGVADVIDYIQRHVIYEDETGKNMLLGLFDTKRLAGKE